MGDHDTVNVRMYSGRVKVIFGIYEGIEQGGKAATGHSDRSLTVNVSTDPKLLDVAGAVASLAYLPLGAIGGPAEAVIGR